MNKTILFFLALMLVTTTACGRGNSNNNPVKEETMTTEGDGKVIHLHISCSLNFSYLLSSFLCSPFTSASDVPAYTVFQYEHLLL